MVVRPPPTLLEISSSSLTNILPSVTKLLLSPKPVAITFANFAVSGLTSICQLPVPLLPTSILHSKLDYCNSLYYKPPKSQLSRLQQIQNSLARTVVKDQVLSYHSYPIYALSTERIEYKFLSLTYKVLKTTQPPYLHNLISVHCLHPSFILLLGHRHHHV